MALHDAAGLHGVPWNESSSVAASILLEDPRVNPNVQVRLLRRGSEMLSGVREGASPLLPCSG